MANNTFLCSYICCLLKTNKLFYKQAHIPWLSKFFSAGMQAFYEVTVCDSSSGSKIKPGVVRNFYLAAEKVQWNYAPSENNVFNAKPLTEEGR